METDRLKSPIEEHEHDSAGTNDSSNAPSRNGARGNRLQYLSRGVAKYIGQATSYWSGRMAYESLFLNVTSRCNLDCVYCEVNSLDHTKDVGFERLTDLLREAKEVGMREVTLSGGEPFVYKHVWKLIDHGLSIGLRMRALTNGVTITKFTEEQMAVLKRMDRVLVSLESHSPEVHDKLRGARGLFEKTVKGIRRLTENGIPTSVQSVVNSENYRGLSQLIELSKELGCDSIYFQPLHSSSNYAVVERREEKDAFLVAQDQHRQLRESLRASARRAKEIGIQTNLQAIEPWIDVFFEAQMKKSRRGVWMEDMMPSYMCREIITKLFIHSDGGVLPCAMLSARDNIKDKSLKEALRSLDRLKEKVRKQDYPAECNKCSCAVGGNYTFSVAASPFRNFEHLVGIIKSKF